MRLSDTSKEASWEGQFRALEAVGERGWGIWVTSIINGWHRVGKLFAHLVSCMSHLGGQAGQVPPLTRSVYSSKIQDG